MAIAMQGGSGEFVQEREWTCAIHDYPASHECDCQFCVEPDVPECCAGAKWVLVANEDGSPKMRELGSFEALLRKQPLQAVSSLFVSPSWLDDVPTSRGV